MLKQFSICAALVALGMGSANAQYREAVLQKVEVPAAGFDILLATAKPDGWRLEPHLDSWPWAPVVYLGDGLAHPITKELLRLTGGVDALTLPACSFQADDGRGSPGPVALYVVPKDGVRRASTTR